MTEHYNGLTPAEAERLAMLAEEAGEIVQMVGKILRHGYESYHPDHPGETNRQLLYGEIADLRGVMLLMSMAGDMNTTHDEVQIITRAKKKMRYAHHQDDCDSLRRLAAP